MTSWLFPSLHGYRCGWLRGDLIAGLTVWAVLVPEALAYASIAGVSPVVGLYAAPGALILYAALGSSRRGAVGGDRRCARADRQRSLRGDDRRAGDHDRARRAAGRAVAFGIPCELHLRAGDQGLHRRAGADDHHRSGPEAVRHREGHRRLLPAAVACDRPPRRHAGHDAARRRAVARGDPRAAAARTRRPRLARGRAARHRRGQAVPSE